MVSEARRGVNEAGRALEEDRLPDAYALTTGLPEGEQGFRERYADVAVRRERAASVRAAVGDLGARAPNLIVEQREDTWRVVEMRPAVLIRKRLS